MLAEDVARQSSEWSPAEPHDIMELHGLGKEIWEGIDPQQYVDELTKRMERPAVNRNILTGISRIGIDTAPIIYFVEAHPKYDKAITKVFANISPDYS